MGLISTLRAPRLTNVFPGLVYTPAILASSQYNAWSGSNTARYVRVGMSGIISKIAVDIGTSSGNICVAVFQNTGTAQSSAPGTRVATSGSVASPGTGYREVSLGGSVAVSAGDWLYLNADNTTVTFRATPPGTGPTGSNAGLGLTMQEAVGAVAAPATGAGAGGVLTWCPVMVGLP